MKKFLKIIGVIVLLLLICMIALPFFFKDQIIDAVKASTNDNLNAKVAFEDVKLNLFTDFPDVHVDITKVDITGIDEFSETSLFKTDNISASMDLSSLFGDELVVKSLEAENPEVNIIVLENGKANYDIAKASAETEETSHEVSNSPFKMNLDEYVLKNANVIYSDATMPMYLELKETDGTGAFNLDGDLYTLTTKTVANSGTFSYDGINYINKAKLDADAVIEIDNANAKYSFRDNEIFLNDLKLQADGWVAMPTDEIDMDINFATVDSDIKQLVSMIPLEFSNELNSIQTAGMMSFDGFIKGVYSDVSMPGFGLNLNVDQGMFQFPDLPEAVRNMNIKAVIDASKGMDSDAMFIDVSKCYLEIAENPIDFAFKVTTPYSDPHLDCDLKAKIILESLKQAIPLEKGDNLKGSINADVRLHGNVSSIEQQKYSDFDAAGQMIVQQVLFQSDSLPYDLNVDVAYLNFSSAFVDVSQFKAQVGETDLQANGKITNYIDYIFNDDLLTGSFNVNSDYMNLNEFMSDSEEEVISDNPSAEEAMGVIEIPSNLDFALNADFKKMKYGDIDISDVSGTIKMVDKEARLQNLGMKLLGGEVNISGLYNTSSIKPLVDVVFDISNMDIEAAANNFYTIEKLAPIAKSCTGKFSTELSFKTLLSENMEPIFEEVSGNGKASTKSIFIEKFEPLNKLANELKIDKLSQQNFENLNMSFSIEDGKVQVQPFVVKLDGMEATIDGTMTFEQELDYNVNMDLPLSKIPGNLNDHATGLLGQLNDKYGTNISMSGTVPVSIKIKGTLTNPTVNGNYGELIQDQKEELKEEIINQVKEEVEEQVEEVKEDAVAKAREEADKLVAEAQKQADKIKAEAAAQVESLRSTGYTEAQKIEDSAKNPLEKLAKKALADKARKETDKQCDNLIAKANEKAQNIVTEAEKKAENMISEAENK